MDPLRRLVRFKRSTPTPPLSGKECADGLARSHAEVPGLSGFQLPTDYLQKLNSVQRDLDLSTSTPRCSYIKDGEAHHQGTRRKVLGSILEVESIEYAES